MTCKRAESAQNMNFFFSIKAKMVVLITALMAVIFLMIAFLFINEKKDELALDVFTRVKAFAELTAPDIAEMTDLYLEEEGFVYFNREIQKMFEQDEDISAISVVSYSGQMVYDSLLDKDKKYDGGDRVTGIGFVALEQIRTKNPSILIQSGDTLEGSQIYYLKDGQYVNVEEKILAAPEKGFQISYLVQPASDKYFVVYSVTYEHMDVKVASMIRRILATAGFGFLLGILIALYMSARITNPVRKLAEGAGAIAGGNLQYHVDITSRDELGFLGNAFNQMAVDLEKSMEARVYKERVGREIELARKIQSQIIPKTLPKISGLDVAAGLIPAEEVGGDMYDFIPLGGGDVLMYLGDVTGHGIPACIVGAIANSLFYSYSGVKDLKTIVRDVNVVLKKKMMANMFMTTCLLKWEASRNVLSYVNAGHEPILCYSAKPGQVMEGDKGGLALGMIADLGNVKEVGINMQSGDVVVIYSDGIVEAWKNEKETYGMDRLKKIVSTASKAKRGTVTATEIKDAILADVAKFTAGYKQRDDVTLIVVKKV